MFLNRSTALCARSASSNTASTRVTERIRKAGGSHHLDLQGVSFSQLIEHIRELDRDHYPRTSDYRYQEPRSLSECDKAVAALIVEAVMLAFDFGSLPLVATDNARAAVESVIPLIDAELGYFRRLVALIGDTTASAPSRAVAEGSPQITPKIC